MRHTLHRQTSKAKRIIAASAAMGLLISQLAMPMATAEAAALGQSSLGPVSALPPSISTAESFQTDLFSGRAATSYTISVPPGRSGMQPDITLNYSSTGQSSWVGYGWGLDMGYIERTVKYGTPSYDDTKDKFAFSLQGVSSELVELSAGSGQFRAKDEGTFMKFIKNTSQDYWEVYDKSGTLYRFGSNYATTQSQINNSINTKTFRWMLERVEDTHGNYMTYKYEEGLISEIHYTGFTGATSLAPTHRVVFNQEGRIAQDEYTSYKAGFELFTQTRLKSIQVYADNTATPSREYRLEYITSPRTSRTLLSKITEYAHDGQSLVAFDKSTEYEYKNNNITYDSPVLFQSGDPGANEEHHYPQLVGDPDGNGVQDLIIFNGSTSKWRVKCVAGSSKCNYQDNYDWISWLNEDNQPLLGDWDGDGKTDIGGFNPTNNSFQVALSRVNANGDPYFSENHTMFGPSSTTLNYGEGSLFTGDFNGDGMTDLGTYNGLLGEWRIWLVTRVDVGGQVVPRFVEDSNFKVGGFGGVEDQPLIGDFNGDGLTDIAMHDLDDYDYWGGSNPSQHHNHRSVYVRFSNGANFVIPPSGTKGEWLPGVNLELSAADINGDGRTDIIHFYKDPLLGSPGDIRVWYSDGTGFITGGLLPVALGPISSDDDVQFGDLNGDGVMDPATYDKTDGSFNIAYAVHTVPDLLKTIKIPQGGRTELTYVPSSENLDGRSVYLPFIIPLLETSTQHDGMGNAYTTTYEYEKGVYYPDAINRESEFRGFGEVKAIDPDGNVQLTKFFQGKEDKGRPEFIQKLDNNEHKWSEEIYTYETVHPYEVSNGVMDSYYTREKTVTTNTFDSNTDFMQSRVAYDYDDYGNITLIHEEGDTSFTDDDRKTEITYLSNTTKWILDKPATIIKKDNLDAPYSQRQFYYDEQAHGVAPQVGELSKQESWLVEDVSNPTKPDWVETFYEYDDYGNQTKVKDDLLRETFNTYDPVYASTFLTKTTVFDETNKEFSIETTYDPLTGQVLTNEDYNGLTSVNEYDEFGRLVLTKIRKPDLTEITTSQTAYRLGSFNNTNTSIANRKTTTVYTDEQGSFLTTYEFSDGMGRTIQTRSPAQDPNKQIVSGTVQFNPRGLVHKQWLPYLDTSPGIEYEVVPESEVPTPTEYLYDPLGRLIQINEPFGDDQTVSSMISYDNWVVTTTDAKFKTTEREQDAYGQLIRVKEHGNAETYYFYDARGNLKQVTDSEGNVTLIKYDSLGRKIEMNDPDMGVWTYQYDTVGNLEAQTDARNVAVTFDYDVLNRLKLKTLPEMTAEGIAEATVTYNYNDPDHIEKVSSIVDTAGSGTISYTYNDLGRVVSEKRTINSTDYIVGREYDLLGRTTEMTYPISNQVVSYTYNNQGGYETIELNEGGTITSILQSAQYDENNQITQLFLGNGIKTDYGYYNASTRLKTLKSYLDSNPSNMIQDNRYEFDNAGNVKDIFDDTANDRDQSFTYDDLHRLESATGNNTYGVVGYQYSSHGNMESKAGLVLTYGTQGPGQVRPHAVLTAGPNLSFGYDANGNMISKTHALDSSRSRTMKFNQDNRLVEVATPASGSTGVEFKTGWNFFTLPVNTTEALISDLFPNFTADFLQITYYDQAQDKYLHYVGDSDFDEFTTLEYGKAYQVYCKSSGKTLNFTEGSSGSVSGGQINAGWYMLPTVGTQALALNVAFAGLTYGQIQGFNKTTQAIEAATMAEPGQSYWVEVTATSIWNPPTPSTNTGSTTSFVYDPSGSRVKKTTTSGGETLYIGEHYEKTGGNTTISIFMGARRIATKHSTQGLRYYLRDHLGSSSIITDDQGAIVQDQAYKPFGEFSVQSAQDSASLPDAFTGQRLDASTGFMYYKARYYDPEIGRFISPDTIVPDFTNPQALNRYSYVANNPLRFIDPTGHSSSPFDIGGRRNSSPSSSRNSYSSQGGGNTNYNYSTSNNRGNGGYTRPSTARSSGGGGGSSISYTASNPSGNSGRSFQYRMQQQRSFGGSSGSGGSVGRSTGAPTVSRGSNGGSSGSYSNSGSSASVAETVSGASTFVGIMAGGVAKFAAERGVDVSQIGGNVAEAFGINQGKMYAALNVSSDIVKTSARRVGVVAGTVSILADLASDMSLVRKGISLISGIVAMSPSPAAPAGFGVNVTNALYGRQIEAAVVDGASQAFNNTVTVVDYYNNNPWQLQRDLNQ